MRYGVGSTTSTQQIYDENKYFEFLQEIRKKEIVQEAYHHQLELEICELKKISK